MQFTPNGIYTAIVTPFTEADEFDEQAFRRLIDFQVASGAAGLLVIGGSGEFVSLTPSERRRVIDVAIDHAARRIPIIVGALAPGTREVQETVRYADRAGASAVLVCRHTTSRPVLRASTSTSRAWRTRRPFRSSPTTTRAGPASRSM